MVRLPSKLWVEALIRTVEVAGSSAFVVQKGDAERGDTLIKVSRLDGTATAYTPSTNLEGERIFRNLLSQGDLWVVEIEDREGRHFLTEDIED